MSGGAPLGPETLASHERKGPDHESTPKTRSALAALALTIAALGAGQALAAKGGLSVDPGILEHVAQPRLPRTAEGLQHHLQAR